jgi:hypothetical protein
LRLVDGHLPQDTLDDDEIDVCVLDLEPEEGRKILATHDAIGALAEVDHQALETLIAEANVDNPALPAMLSDLAERSLNGPTDEARRQTNRKRASKIAVSTAATPTRKAAKSSLLARAKNSRKRFTSYSPRMV